MYFFSSVCRGAGIFPSGRRIAPGGTVGDLWRRLGDLGGDELEANPFLGSGFGFSLGFNLPPAQRGRAAGSAQTGVSQNRGRPRAPRRHLEARGESGAG